MSDRSEFMSQLRGQLLDAAPEVERRRRRSQRIVAVAAAAGLGSAAIALIPAVVDDDGPSEVVAAAGNGSPSTASDGGDLFGETWTSLDTSIGGEAEPGVFWTGSQVLVMRTENGGDDVTGELWNPATNEATRIAASNLSWRVGAAMAWTGDELLVVGGSSGPALSQVGAAYDPAEDTWRAIADPPGSVDAWENALTGPGVWTGEEMIVWSAGLSYDPATDTWRTIAAAPLSQRASPITVWTGAELIVWGGCWVEGGQCDEMNSGLLADGAVYDPTNDLWIELPASPLPGAVHVVAGWSGTEMIAVVTDPAESGASPAAAFDPTTMSWRTLASSPLAPRRGAAGVAAGDRFVVWGGGDGASDAGLNEGAAYDPGADRWEQLPQSPGPGLSLHSMLATEVGIYITATRTQGPPLLLQVPTGSTPPPDTTSAPAVHEDCLAAPTRQPGSGLVGLPIDDVWPQGPRDGFDLTDPAYATVDDPNLEGSWYVIGAVVRDLGGRPLGLGVWLMPDPIVGYIGQGEPTTPANDPVNWHLYAYNELAKESSVWRPSDVTFVESDPADAIRPCLVDSGDALPFINGTLLDGSAWLLTDDPIHGLCLAESGVDYGCDDVGPVVQPDDPPETMRIAGTLNPAPGVSEDNAGDLAYGYLATGAVAIELRLSDGSIYTTAPVVDPAKGLWAAPIEPGNNPTVVRYLDADGQEVASSSR